MQFNRLFTISLALAMSLSVACAGQKPKPKTNTQKKPVVTKPTPGAAMLPGDNGKLGTLYVLGNKDEQIYFRLEKAEFAMQWVNTRETVCAKKGERLLILSYTLQNPRKTSAYESSDSLRFTVVSPKDENFEGSHYTYNTLDLSPFGMDMKPTQKVALVTAISIHDIGPVNKLMVARGDGKVLRYDLRGLVGKLTGPFAAANGVDALETGNAAYNQSFNLGMMEYTIVSCTKNQKAATEDEDAVNEYVIRLRVKNPGKNNDYIDSDLFNISLSDESGVPFTDYTGARLAGRSQGLSLDCKPGQSVEVDAIVRFSDDLTPKTLRFVDREADRGVEIKL